MAGLSPDIFQTAGKAAKYSVWFGKQSHHRALPSICCDTVCDGSPRQMEFPQSKRRSRGIKMLKKTPQKKQAEFQHPQLWDRWSDTIQRSWKSYFKRPCRDSALILKNHLLNPNVQNHVTFSPQRPCSRLPAGVYKSLIGVLTSPDFTYDISHNSLGALGCELPKTTCLEYVKCCWNDINHKRRHSRWQLYQLVKREACWKHKCNSLELHGLN